MRKVPVRDILIYAPPQNPFLKGYANIKPTFKPTNWDLLYIYSLLTVGRLQNTYIEHKKEQVYRNTKMC